MSAEEELLNDIFGETKYWTSKRGVKYKLHWCDVCEVWTLICPTCKNNGCNGGGCKECSGVDWEDWRKCKYVVWQYFSEADRIVLHRADLVKKYIVECLGAGFSEINWEWLHKQGKLCQWAYAHFEELKDLKYEDWDK